MGQGHSNPASLDIYDNLILRAVSRSVIPLSRRWARSGRAVAVGQERTRKLPPVDLADHGLDRPDLGDGKGRHPVHRKKRVVNAIGQIGANRCARILTMPEWARSGELLCLWEEKSREGRLGGGGGDGPDVTRGLMDLGWGYCSGWSNVDVVSETEAVNLRR